MTFTPKTWINEINPLGPPATPPGTPLNAAALVDMETRLSDYTDLRSPFLNVKDDYGAVGDGTTDDTTAVEAALDAANAAGGGIVYFPTGTYKLTANVTVHANTRITGEGKSSVIKTDDNVICKSYTEVDHLHFITVTAPARDGDDIITAANVNALLYFYDDPNRLSNCSAHHLTGDGLHIEFYKVDGFSCFDNSFRAGWDGAISLFISTLGQVINNWCAGSQADGIATYGGGNHLFLGNRSNKHHKSGFFAYGALAAPDYAGATQLRFIDNEAADSVTEEGFDINAVGNSVYTYNQFIGNHVHGNAGWGIFSPGSGTLFEGNQCYENGAQPIRVSYDANVAAQAAAHNVQIKNNHCYDNNTAGHTGGSGLDVGIEINWGIDCQVTGNTVIQPSTGNKYTSGALLVGQGYGNIVRDNIVTSYIAADTSTMISATPDTGKTNTIRPNRVGPGEPVGTAGPSTRVYNSGALTHNSTGNWFTCTFDSERFDTETMHSTSSATSRITINTAGVYNVAACVGFDANATGSRAIRFVVNNTSTIALHRVDAVADAGQRTVLSTATLWKFAAGDYVVVDAWQNSGGNLSLPADALPAYPEFSAHWVGDG